MSNGEGSGDQSGEPQSIKILTSSICNRYDSGVVFDERADPDKGVKVIISRRPIQFLGLR
jgi:hypothetical protein